MSEYCKNCYELTEKLQAKEQECKKIKDKNQYMKDYIKTVETSRNELEQECEKLKTQTSNFMNGEYCANGCKKMHKQFKKVHNNLVEENKKLKQECEELKKQYNCYACGTCNGKEDYKNMQRHCENAIKANHKYKQSLDEIKEFCTVYSNNHDAYETVYKYILNIINKAKEQ